MVRNARIKIQIGDVFRPYTEGEWVMFNRDAFPVGFMHVERKHLKEVRQFGYAADPLKAFSDYWTELDENPVAKAMDGYTVKLIPREDLDAYLKRHTGRVE